MTLELGGTLILLALVDSLSIGTLVIPLFFLIAPGRLRLGRILAYLSAIAVFYLALGVVITAGLGAIITDLGEVLATGPARVAQLVIGAGLFALSFWIGRKRDPAEAEKPGRLSRWRDRAMGDDGGAIALVVLAIGAGLAEVATMLPYLGAIGLLSAAPLDDASRLILLLGYCFVMIVPALVLTLLRVVARRMIEPVLARLAAWMQKNAAENTAWIVAIVGFLLARDAATTLGLFGG